MKATKNIISAVALAAVLGSASAATLSYTGIELPVQKLDLPGASSIAIPQFNVANITDKNCVNARLTGVQIRLYGFNSTQGTFENLNPAAGSFNVSINTTFTLSTPGGSAPASLSINPVINYVTGNVAAGGTVNIPSTGSSLADSGLVSVSPTGPFVGVGSLNLGITSATIVGIGGGGGTAVQTPPSFANIKVDVVYTYVCDNPVIPEPKVYGAIGALLSLGVLGYRQYRAKRA